MGTDPAEFVTNSTNKYEPESGTADAADVADDEAKAHQLTEEQLKLRKLAASVDPDDHIHQEEIIDQWGEDSFPASDPPGHY